MRVRCWGLAAMAVVMTVSTSAHAQPMQFMFANSSGTYTTNFAIPVVGGTVAIQVFLNDTGAASSFFTNATQTANLLTNALRGAGLKITSSNPAAARWAERDRKRAEAAVEVVRTRCLWCDWFFDGPMALGKQELETHRCRDGHNQPTSLPPGGDWYSTADPEERPSRITLRPRPQAVA